MSRPVCSICMMLIDDGGCGCQKVTYPRPVSKEAATTLRQQQARIKQLEEPETPCEELRRLQNEENNEPVAWIGETLMGRQYINGQKVELPVGTPLYTNPVKELTDEEIIEIGLLTTDPRFSHIESPLLLEFARAILRKAQEK